jgi:hypothetical protein
MQSVGTEEDLTLQGTADQVDQTLGQVGQIGQSAVLDLAVLAVGLAQQVADVDPVAVLALDLGHVHSCCGLPHAAIVAMFSFLTRISENTLGYTSQV